MFLSHQQGLTKPNYEVSDIFNRYFNDYNSRHKLSLKQYQVIRNIRRCRTGELGSHLLACDHCDYQEISHNSCGDRHCPKCQYRLKIKWVNARLEELLPIPYYHVVFTLPHFFNDLFLYNKKNLYDLFFNCASQTLKTFAEDPKYLGAQLGYIGILHTWGQTLGQHVHIHYIVSGGGLSVGGKWVSLPCKSKFLFPVRALSKMFRGKFISRFKKLYEKGKLEIPDSLSCLKQDHILDHYLNSIHSKKWMVYAKKPFSSPEEVVRYIGRYTHRIAISNYRIRSIENHQVQFDYRDYKDKGIVKLMTLSAEEFIRRFLLHILPKGFKKIRFYGFWANGQKRFNIPFIKGLLGNSWQSANESERELKEKYQLHCPRCNEGFLNVIDIFRPVYYANTS